VFVATFAVTLATDLLIGVGVGIVVKLLIHLKNGAPLWSLLSPDIDEERGGNTLILRVHGSAVFTNYLALRKRLDHARDRGLSVLLDLSNARLVDHTVRQKIAHLIGEGRPITLEGLDEHEKLGRHELAALRKAVR
jgi:MFS superfamily sulfate permease-like transporter